MKKRLKNLAFSIIIYNQTTKEKKCGVNMIIFENQNYIICKKAIGVSSQKTEGNNDMPSLLSESTGIPANSIYTIHRLDNLVGGTMVYATSKDSASKLSALVSDNKMQKTYLAVIHGKPEEKSGLMEDLLFKDSSKNKSYVVKRMRKGVKRALLEYELLDTVQHNGSEISLVKIRLHTGRTHQIRVQFSHRKMPLLGDRRYGSGKDDCSVALWSHKIEFTSPFDGEAKTYSSLPDAEKFPWCLFNLE